MTNRGSLFGVELLLGGLFEGDGSSIYERLAEHGSALIRDEDFADCYSGAAVPAVIATISARQRRPVV